MSYNTASNTASNTGFNLEDAELTTIKLFRHLLNLENEQTSTESDFVDISELERLKLYERDGDVLLLLDMNGDYLRWWNIDKSEIITDSNTSGISEINNSNYFILIPERSDGINFKSLKVGDIVRLRDDSYAVVVHLDHNLKYPIRIVGLSEGYYYLTDAGREINGLKSSKDIMAISGLIIFS